MNDLEAQAAEIHQQLRECRDPQEHTRLTKSLQSTMQAIHDNRPAPSHREEIQARRANGEVGAADAMGQVLDVKAAQARIQEAQHAIDDGATGFVLSKAERQLKAAEADLEAAQKPTPMRAAQIERDRLYDESRQMEADATLLKRSPLSEERLKGAEMAEDAKNLMTQFHETRVEV